MIIYLPVYDEDIVDEEQLPDNRYTDSDLDDLYGEWYTTFHEAKEALDNRVKGK